MENTAHPFMFIVSLAAVVNGLGIVRLVSAFAEYLKIRHKVEIRYYWAFTLFAVLQLLLHIFFWWSLWSLRDTESFNFLQYLFLLSGPTLLYLATNLLAPALNENVIDLEAAYFNSRRTFFSVMSLVWLWCVLLRPLLGGALAQTWPYLVAFLASSLLLRFTEWRPVHTAVAIFQWLLMIVFIGLFGMQLGNAPSPLN